MARQAQAEREKRAKIINAAAAARPPHAAAVWPGVPVAHRETGPRKINPLEKGCLPPSERSVVVPYRDSAAIEPLVSLRWVALTA